MADKWIKKMWYIYTMEFFYLAIKNEILSFAGKWMKLGVTMLNEISQSHKDKSNIFSHMYVDLRRREMKVKAGALGVWKEKRRRGKVE
jgi:hypothetical protein